LKVLYILPQGKVPRLMEHVMVRVTTEHFDQVYEQYRDYPGKVCLLVHPDVYLPGLLKFVEEANGDLAVVVNRTPDTMFLSRFSSHVVGLKIQYYPFPSKSRSQVLFEECRKLCL